MDITLSTQPRASTRQPLAALGKLTIAALIGDAAMLGYAQTIFGGFDPIMTGFAVAFLVVAGVVAVGWRWAPALGALVSLLLAGGLLAPAITEVVFSLTHPSDFGTFSLLVVLLPLLLIGLISGIAATVQNYRGGTRRAPRWLSPALIALGGLIAGAILVAAAPQPGSGVSADALSGLQVVALDAFNNGEIHVKAAETVALRLENSDSVGHAFAVDALNLDAPMPGGKSGLALFKASKPGTYTFYCSIPGHYDKASGEGMTGKLIIEP
jgi:uncharacterized cupredoxin-like copper-binding protein